MTAQGIKNTVLVVISSAGSWIANELGGWDAAMKVLIAMMAVDYISGLTVAGVWHRSGKSETGALDSRAGFKGLVKKVFTILLVWIGVLLDKALGTAYVRTAIIIFFIGNEGLSLLENFGLMGVPYPEFLRKALEALREKGDGKDKDTSEIIGFQEEDYQLIQESDDDGAK